MRARDKHSPTPHAALSIRTPPIAMTRALGAQEEYDGDDDDDDDDEHH